MKVKIIDISLTILIILLFTSPLLFLVYDQLLTTKYSVFYIFGMFVLFFSFLILLLNLREHFTKKETKVKLD